MLKTSLAVLGAIAIAVVALGAHVDGTAKPISQIPITQAFRMHLGQVGNLNRKGTVMPYTATAPANAGVAITDIYSRGDWDGNWRLGIRVNGMTVFDAPVGIDNNINGLINIVSFQSPITVPPTQCH